MLRSGVTFDNLYSFIPRDGCSRVLKTGPMLTASIARKTAGDNAEQSQVAHPNRVTHGGKAGVSNPEGSLCPRRKDRRMTRTAH